MSAAPKDSPGVASGILRTLTNLGAVIEVAIFEILFSLFLVDKNANTGIHAKTLAGFSPESIISGLHFVTILAAVLYGFALLFSILTPGKQIAKIHCDQQLNKIA